MDPQTLERRCPRLGGDVAFGYCKVCGENKAPCFKVLDCWWERFDVVAYMQTCLSPEAFKALKKKSRPPDKVSSLLALIQQAQERTSTP